jgi:hypothetical protein
LFFDLGQALASLQVRAWRLTLEIPEVVVTLPMLRGVWGAALFDLAPAWYESLFEGKPSQFPRYLLRAAPGFDGHSIRELDFILFGPPHWEAESVTWAAWDLALQRGLGPQRRPAGVTSLRPLAWEGTALTPARTQPGFALAPLPWPMAPQGACVVRFRSPLRLLREGRLIDQPTLADVVIATMRRAQGLAPEAMAQTFARRGTWLELARAVPAEPFVGEPRDLVRYSGRQRSELELRGVVGELRLPAGPGPLAGLLLAAQWLGIGKGTVMGMGQLEIVPG